MADSPTHLRRQVVYELRLLNEILIVGLTVYMENVIPNISEEEVAEVVLDLATLRQRFRHTLAF